jgi:hypothetical protein
MSLVFHLDANSKVETNDLFIRLICICGYRLTLSVTGSHKGFISVYVFCMKGMHESRTPMSLLFVDGSDDIQLGAHSIRMHCKG